MEAAVARLAKLAADSGPLLVVLVGPNGAGKSTLYEQYLKRLSLPFVNADVIARTLTEAGAPAGEETERRRRELIAKSDNFITETVFSDPVGAKVEALRGAQETGYTVVMLFVCVESAELSVLRVRSRVIAGGHDVPADRIAARYDRMRKNVKAALSFVDLAVVVDNSALDRPLNPVAVVGQGRIIDQKTPLPEEQALPTFIGLVQFDSHGLG